MIRVNDFEEVIEKHPTSTLRADYVSGPDDEYSKREAVRAFRKLTIRPRVLRNVDTIDT